MKKREIKAMRAIEKHMERLGPRAQDRVAVWTASRWAGIEFEPLEALERLVEERAKKEVQQSKDFVERFWSAKPMNGVIALMYYDITVGAEVIADVLGVTSSRKLAAELVVAGDRLELETPPVVYTPEEEEARVGVGFIASSPSRSSTLDAGVLGGPDGIFGEVDDEDNDKLSDAEMTASVYGMIRMGLKDEAMSLLIHNPEAMNQIIRGTGREDLFGQGSMQKEDGGVYTILEQLAKGEAPPRRTAMVSDARIQAFAALCGAVRRVLIGIGSYDEMPPGGRDGNGDPHDEAVVLVQHHREELTKIVQECTHECMLPTINEDKDLVSAYAVDKPRLVRLWDEMRLALGLAYEPSSR